MIHYTVWTFSKSTHNVFAILNYIDECQLELFQTLIVYDEQTRQIHNSSSDSRLDFVRVLN